jgi:sigma-E factor negative regulatory protein RseC
MIEQQGRVVAVDNGMAEVRLGGTAGCARCDAGKGCGAGVFGRLLKRRPVTLRLDNTVDAGEGQPVMVGIPETMFLRLAARLYLYPLLAGLGGAAVGYYFSTLGNVGPIGTDLITLAGGLTSGLAALKWSGKGENEFSGSFIVHLLRVIEFQETRKQKQRNQP